MSVDATDSMELRLIDLGFARAPGFSSRPSGTPHYMAPELWRGEVAPAADVFALGVSVSELLSPRLPQPLSASASEHLAHALQPRAALPSWVPAPLAELLTRMCARDPSERIVDGSELLEALRQLAELLPKELASELSGDAADARSKKARASLACALPLIGRAPSLDTLSEALRQTSVVVIHGASGVGRSRIVRDAVFRCQAERAQRGEPIPNYRVVTSLPESIEAAPQVLHVLDADAIASSDVWALLRAAELAGQRHAIVLERLTPSPDDRILNVNVPALDSAQVGELLRHALPARLVQPALIEEARIASGGLAARLCRLIGAALLKSADLAQPGWLRDEAQRSAHAELFVPELLQPLAAGLALAGGSLSQDAASLLMPAERLAEAAHVASTLGLCTRGADGQLSLRPDVQLALSQNLPRAEQQRIAQLLAQADLDLRARGFVFAASGDHAASLEAFVNALQKALAAGEPAKAERTAREATRVLGGTNREVIDVLRAESLRALGRYPEALGLLQACPGVAARLLSAELQRLRGDAAGARECALALFREPNLAATERRSTHALLARLAFDAGEFASSQEHALAASVVEDEPAARRGSEVLALLDLQQGELGSARATLDAAFTLARRHAERAAEARLFSVLGSVQRAQGVLRAAAKSFGRAYELAEAQGEYHAAASFLVNLGSAELDAGELGSALRHLRHGSAALARLGRERDLARALTNLTLAAQLAGDFARALSFGAAAEQAARNAGDVCASVFALLSCAEVLAERGDLAAASARLGELPDLHALSPTDHALALGRIAQLWAAQGELVRAQETLSSAATLSGSAESAAAEIALGQAALAQARGESASALEHAEHALAFAKQRGEYAVLVLSLLASAAAAQAEGQSSLSRSRFAELRSLLDSAALTLTAAERSQLRGVKAYQVALSLLPTPPRRAPNSIRVLAN